MHWKHSRFEIAHIILGNCHTYDEAYRILCELEEDRQFAIDSSMAESLRAQAKVVSAKVILDDNTEMKSGKLRADADIQEQKARTKTAQPALDEARRELDFIRRLKERINEHRAFREYDDHHAHQLCQPIEWKLDLNWKTYNHLCSAGGIPYDHIMLLKMHPDSDLLMRSAQTMMSKYQENPSSFMLLSKSDVQPCVLHDSEKPALMCDTQDLRLPDLTDTKQEAIGREFEDALTVEPEEAQNEV